MKRVIPDGLTGAILAVESIPDAAVMFHGPGGCRIRHMVTSSATFPRIDPEDEPPYTEPYYYGYSRVPSTYLDEHDYINGAYCKMEEGLGTVGRKEPSLIVVIDSPGAGLIGDDHRKAASANMMEDRTLVVDEALSSMPFTAGYDRTLRRILDHMSPERGSTDGTVLLIGMDILEKDWYSAVEEMKDLLGSMGLEVGCAPGAGASLEELENSVNAEYAVVVCPELCVSVSEFYRSKGVKIIRSEHGAPVGFDAIESWIKTIAESTGMDPSPALDKVDTIRNLVYRKFIGMRYNSLRIRGLTFSVAGISSIVRPLTEWLYGYLAIAPVAVDIDPGYDEKEVDSLKRFLESKDYGDSFGKEPLEGSSIVLCEGMTALTMLHRGDTTVGIPIGHSTMGLDDIIP
ncbi:MAG: hypothetical protein MJZ68_09685, partial [archaeon]|nr:hypothetical protein [archaeon]